MAAINGFDSFGHYLRARLILNTCSRYYIRAVDGCSGELRGFASSASRAPPPRRPPTATRSSAAPWPRSQGKDPDSVAPLPEMTATPQPVKRTASKQKRQAKAAPVPSAPAPAAGPAPASPTPAPSAAPQQAENVSEGEAVLDYLFGKDAG